MGFLRSFALRVQLQVGLELGDGFVLFFHLLRDFGEGEVGGGVVWLNVYRIFGAEIGTLVVLVAHIKLRDREVFVDTLVVGLDSFDLGEFAMDGGAGRGIAVFV